MLLVGQEDHSKPKLTNQVEDEPMQEALSTHQGLYAWETGRLMGGGTPGRRGQENNPSHDQPDSMQEAQVQAPRPVRMGSREAKGGEGGVLLGGNHPKPSPRTKKAMRLGSQLRSERGERG